MRKLTQMIAALAVVALCGIAIPDEAEAGGTWHWTDGKGTWHWTDGKGTWHWTDGKGDDSAEDSERQENRVGESEPDAMPLEGFHVADNSDSFMIFWGGAFRDLWDF